MLRIMFEHGPQLVGILQREGEQVRYVSVNNATAA